MRVDLKIPSMGESISEVTIGQILKESGSFVEQDEEVLEIETDKLNQVLYAPAQGTLTLDICTGDKVTIGQVIGKVDTDTQKPVSLTKDDKKSNTKEKQEILKQKTSTTPIAQGTSQKLESESQGIQVSRNSWAHDVQTGKQDNQKGNERKHSPHFARDPRGEKYTPMTSVRKAIAQRMLWAKNETAMLTTFNEADMSHVMHLRETYRDDFLKKHGTKLGISSFFVKAVVSALEAFPQVNSFINQEFIVSRNYIDISVAISTDRGVIVPVLRDANAMSYADIEKKIDDFATRAKNGTLTASDLQGGGFTITNGGVFGSLLSTPILNPPQCAILGMHKIVKRPVVINDQIAIRPMMYLALSYDHRIIDGKEAVSFLVHIKECIEDPERLMLEV